MQEEIRKDYQSNPNLNSQNADQNLKIKLQSDLTKNYSPIQKQNGMNIEQEDNLKQHNSLGRISTVILRGNPDDQFVSSPSLKKKQAPPSSYSGVAVDTASKEDNHSRLIKYLKEQKRTKHAAEFLIEQFSQFRFFKQIMRQLSEDLLKQVIFELKLETYKKHQIIFQHNDVGRHMYFILSGKVAILIPSKPQNNNEVNTPTTKQSSTPVATENNPNNYNQQQQQQSNLQQQNSQGTNSVPVSPRIQLQPVSQTPIQHFSHALTQTHTNINAINFKDYLAKMVGLNQIENLTEEEEFEYFRQYKLPNFKQVNTVLAGNTFGEVALEQRIPRTASTVTITPCQLATLSYDSFRKLLSKIYERIQNEQRSFLKEIPPFNNWPNAGIMVIYNNSEEVDYQINNVIYKEGDRCQYVYFIKEGEIEISKVFKIDKCDTSTLQKKNILMKRQVIQRVAQGRMFGEYEGILHLLDPKKKNTLLFNNKQKEALPSRETQAICQTKVKLMRIESRLFFLNFWAFNNTEDQEFFSVQRRNMLEKINKIQNLIDNFQSTNIQNQEINELSEMLQTNSMLQQSSEINKLLRGSISTPKQKYSICTTTPINLHSPQANKKIDFQLKNNSKNKSNDTMSSDRTTILGSPITNSTMKRSSSINFNINISPNSASGGAMSYFSSSNMPQVSPSLIQAAQQNQLLKPPSLFQRLNKIQNSIFEASSPISGRGSEPFANLDSFSSKNNNNQQAQQNIQDYLSPRKSTNQLQMPQRSSQKKNTYSHFTYTQNSPNKNDNLSSPSTNKKLNGNLQLSDFQSPNIYPKEKTLEIQACYPEQLDLNDNSSSHNLGKRQNDSQEIKNQSQPQQQNNSQFQSPARSLQNLNKDLVPKSSRSLQKQKTYDHHVIRGDSEQSHQKNNKKEQQQTLLLEQPLKIFQLKDSRKLKVLRKEIEDKFQEWRDQDMGKKIIRKKKSPSINFNNQAATIINQIQNSISNKNQQFDLRLLKQFKEIQNKQAIQPQTERLESIKQNHNNESNEPSLLQSQSQTHLKLILSQEQKQSLLKSSQFNFENPSDFINILRKSRRNPSAIFSSSIQKQLNESNISEKQNISMQPNSPRKHQNEISQNNLGTQLTHNLQKEPLSPMKIFSMTQDKPQYQQDSPQMGVMQQQYSPNFAIRPLLSPQSTSSSSSLSLQHKENKSTKNGQNFYKFQIVLKQQQDEQSTKKRNVQTQQSNRNKKVINSNNMELQENNTNKINDNHNQDDTYFQNIEFYKNRKLTSKSMSVINYENIRFIQTASKNIINRQTSIAEITQHQTEISQPTLFNNLTQSKKELLPQQTLTYLDQSPIKLKSSGLFSNGQVIRSCSQPNVLQKIQSSQEILVSSSQLKDEKQQQQALQSLIQPLQSMKTHSNVKKNSSSKQISSLEQASKLPPTIKQQNKELIKKTIGFTSNVDNFTKDIKQLGSLKNIDMEYQFVNGQQIQSTKQFNANLKNNKED